MNQRTTSTRKIRYAVVGLGHIAQVAVLPAFRNAKNSELVAVVSGEQEKREKLARKYRLEHLYSYEDYDRALSQVDAVYLAVPNHLHREYAVRAAQARVHVLCEKPMAVTEDDCRAMIAAADEGLLIADPAYEYAMAIRHQLTIGGKTKTRTFPKRDQFAAELVYFSDCVLNDREPEPSGLEGLADVHIVQAIYNSARTRTIVKLPDLPGKKRPTKSQEIHRPSHGKPETVRAKSPSGEAA